MEGKKGGGTPVSTEGKEQEEKPAEEKEKKPAAEEDKKGGGTHIGTEGKEQITSFASTLDGQELQRFGGVEKTQVPVDLEKPASQDDCAEKTHLLAVLEEGDASKKVQLKNKKGKKMKRTELQEIKKKKQLHGAEKTQVPAETEEPASECGTAMISKQQTYLLAVPEEGDASKKQQKKNKKEKSTSKGSGAMINKEQSCLVAIKEEDDCSKNLQLNKKKEKKRKRSEPEKSQVSADTKDLASDTYCPQRWRASYALLLRQIMTKPSKGSLLLDAKLNRIILYNIDEEAVDARDLEEGELIYPGLMLDFACHKVEIGEPILQSKDDSPLPTFVGQRTKKERRHEQNLKRLKREVNKKMLRSPGTKLMRSSIGTYARVASLRRKSESPSVPNVTAHFPSPVRQRVQVTLRGRPRKLKSRVWKEFIPLYEHGKLAEGQCKHCNEVFPASKTSGTNHIHRHLKKCLTRNSMHEMVAKMRASTSSPQVSLDDWNFSQKESRRNLANMIAQHGLPFSIVEYSGFIKFVKGLNPMFKMVSRTTIKDECLESYKEERSLLREMLKNCGSRVSLTADMWTSNQRLGYLCVTCHFIDKTWKMQKRILRFCMMETPHNGFRMYNAMLKSLQYWNIEDKICSITLDNASVNGKMMEYLKENLTKKQMLICGGPLFHIRCGAHVLNLIVQDGLLVMKDSIDNIRDSVKYIKSSQTREELFADIVQQLGIMCEKEPSLDVTTRWNSTYLMIDSALPYREAFEQLVNQDPQFKYAPSADDWKMAEAVRSLLKIFFEATKVVSGSSYPTANRYFHEMWSVKLLLEKQAKNKNKEIASMVNEMKKKFDKYWIESYLANCIPVIFDPRYKFEFVKFRIKQAFMQNAEEQLEKVETIIKSIFKEYSHEMGGSFDDHSEEVCVDEVAEIDNSLADWEAHLREQKQQETSELDRYLSEDLFPQEKNFDILEWWEMHSPKYPVLCRIARDVLAIQASTVASESSFSAGGRIISDHRNRLKSDTVEALICLQDWLKSADPKPTNKDVEEEEYLVFYQGSECHEETTVRDNQRRDCNDTDVTTSPSPTT